MTVSPLPPGSVIGILGGGQLGRMLALAAATLGYRSHVFCPDTDGPASQVTNLTTVAAYDDAAALRRFAAAVQVVTYEFENVPSSAAEIVDAMVPVRPAPRVLAICQDRLREKMFLSQVDMPTTRYAAVAGPAALAEALADIGRPAVLKSAVLGYDGKGQVVIGDETTPEAAWARLATDVPDAAAILEGFVDMSMELSVIVGRGLAGEIRTYDAVENLHEAHILRRTIVPAPISDVLAAEAKALAHRIAEAIDLVGVLAVEMFLRRDGVLLINELAPRPHNSGHWTIDAASTSQFEQCVRAIVGLPLGTPDRLSDAVMENLLGNEANDWLRLFATPGLHVHLYGKGEALPGRKMGHMTRLVAVPSPKSVETADPPAAERPQPIG